MGLVRKPQSYKSDQNGVIKIVKYLLLEILVVFADRISALLEGAELVLAQTQPGDACFVLPVEIRLN